MEKYHLRKAEKAISNESELLAVIDSAKYMTIAMCKDDEPYLATVNFAYDKERRCFYLHCSVSGKKIDYLAANPIVWGQVMVDDGYLKGTCDHAYRTVQFRAKAVLLDTVEEKRRALSLMIEKLEDEATGIKKKLVEGKPLDNVAVYSLQINFISGKINGAGK